MKKIALALLVGLVLCVSVALAQETMMNFTHINGDRDVYDGYTSDKKVRIWTKGCLHKAEDDSATLFLFDGKPYTLDFIGGDSCKAVAIGEWKKQ